MFGAICPRSGETIRAGLPPGVPTGQSGPRLTAPPMLLMASFRLGKRCAVAGFTTLLNQPCSVGREVNLRNLGASALPSCVHELVDALPQLTSLTIDESPTKQRTDNAWL
jgi:hypothetical protein